MITVDPYTYVTYHTADGEGLPPSVRALYHKHLMRSLQFSNNGAWSVGLADLIGRENFKPTQRTPVYEACMKVLP